LVVVDRGYTRIQREWRNKVATEINCPIIQVESDVIVPIETTSNKEEYGAFTIRPKINRFLDRFLRSISNVKLKIPSQEYDFKSLYFDDIESVMKILSLDNSVYSSSMFKGGMHHAQKLLDYFLKNHFDLKKKIRELERDKSSASGVNLNKLKQNLRKLENEQMTQPMSPDKEKKLIETIKEIHTKIKHEEEELNKDPRLKKALEEKVMMKQKAEKQHEIVEKMAKKAQEEHQIMIELLGQLDNHVRRTTEIQEEIVMIKIEADTVHKEFIDYVNKIHDLEKTISGIEKKRDQRKKMATVSAAKKEAYEIYEKFKKGEKLSTEDIMILQKAGLL